MCGGGERFNPPKFFQLGSSRDKYAKMNIYSRKYLKRVQIEIKCHVKCHFKFVEKEKKKRFHVIFRMGHLWKKIKGVLFTY